MEVLKAMPLWSWDEYKNALTLKGYVVYEREDKKGVLRGYALMHGEYQIQGFRIGSQQKPDGLETSCDMEEAAPSASYRH